MTKPKLYICLQPGYLKDLLPTTAPEQGEEFGAIMQDVKDNITPGADDILASPLIRNLA
jgi:hypothetical protein